jgi:formylmethanofuran dehydrogenase subunit B
MFYCPAKAHLKDSTCDQPTCVGSVCTRMETGNYDRHGLAEYWEKIDTTKMQRRYKALAIKLYTSIHNVSSDEAIAKITQALLDARQDNI